MELTSLGICIEIIRIAQHWYMGPRMLKGVKECEVAINTTPKCDFHDYKTIYSQVKLINIVHVIFIITYVKMV
jgi:hypothetical protein